MDHPSSLDWVLQTHHADVVSTHIARGRHTLQTPRLYPPPVTVTFVEIVTATPTKTMQLLPTDRSSGASVGSNIEIMSVGSSVQNNDSSSNHSLSMQPDSEAWVNHIHRLLPVIISFAAIGLLAVLGGLVFLAYRFYTMGTKRRRKLGDVSGDQGQDVNAPQGDEPTVEKGSKSPAESRTLSRILPWLAVRSPQRGRERYQTESLEVSPPATQAVRRQTSLGGEEMREKAVESKLLTRRLAKLFTSEPARILNEKKPISKTFVPIDESPLKLVTRSEIWQDPLRRRGVDELELWEKRKKQKQDQQHPESRTIPQWQLEDDYPSGSQLPHSTSFAQRARVRSSSVTIQEASNSQHPASHQHDLFAGFSSTVQHSQPSIHRSDVAIARDALASSSLENRSSQWLENSGSKSF